MNDAIDDLVEELKGDGLDQVVIEIKAILEDTERQGGCGATPGQAHGGDFTGGDCVNILNRQHRFLALLPVTWPRKVAWTRYFLMLRLVLPPLMRTRFWTGDEITTCEVGQSTNLKTYILY